MLHQTFLVTPEMSQSKMSQRKVSLEKIILMTKFQNFCFRDLLVGSNYEDLDKKPIIF